MKKVMLIAAVLLVSLLGRPGAAFTVHRGYGSDKMVIGGYWSNGLAMVAGDGYEEWTNDQPLLPNHDRDDRTPLYSPGGYFYFDYYLLSIMAIEGGFGFLSKGIRFSDGDDVHKQRIVYMEIPVMVKVDIQHFQFGGGIALFVGLAGKTKNKGTVGNRKYSDTSRWEDQDWDRVHRVNVGPRLYAGYAIPVGPIYIVPSITWMMHLVNDLDNKTLADEQNRSDTDYQMRAVNLMFNVGVEWAF
jgi:hypothetical protein